MKTVRLSELKGENFTYIRNFQLVEEKKGHWEPIYFSYPKLDYLYKYRDRKDPSPSKPVHHDKKSKLCRSIEGETIRGISKFCMAFTLWFQDEFGPDKIGNVKIYTPAAMKSNEYYIRVKGKEKEYIYCGATGKTLGDMIIKLIEKLSEEDRQRYAIRFPNKLSNT